ncbi:MAG: hypothetical protein EAX90_03960 [Candidatus Heimdallarchaeota archaeon]|nr:hypothetical protein [Candidatus Heimdallarchaeota archaeon]
MRFIKISDKEERERLEKFYGWLSGPISEFTDKVQDIIIENTKYYYHANRDVLFVVGTDIDETSIPSIFIPELEEQFYVMFSNADVAAFNGKDIQPFRKFDQTLVRLVKAFDQRKIEARGQRKDLDAFEVLNLPNELQMVSLVLVKMQVVTPEMVSQVTGLIPQEVERQLREVYQRGYLYITTISNKSYFSIKPFGSDDTSRTFISKVQTQEDISTFSEDQTLPVDQSFPTEQETMVTKEQLDIEKAFPPIQEKTAKFTLEDAQVIGETSPSSFDTVESAMMAPPGWDSSLTKDPDDPRIQGELNIPSLTEPETIKPILEELTDEERLLKKETKGIIKLKDDPIAQTIDQTHKVAIVIPKNGQLPPTSLRRERGYISGKVKIPSEKNKDPFLLNNLFKKDLENVFEALLMGDLIVITGEEPEIIQSNIVNKLFETLILLAPHRELKCVKSNFFIHPKDADVIFVPKSLLKYYSWATIIDLDTNKISGGNSTDFSKNLVKKLRKIENSKELVKEVANTTSILLKVSRDINTLKIEGRPPDLYLNEVKKTFGIAALEAGLELSEKLIRLHKDCAYIAGFYIRKGLDIAVRAMVIGEPIVVIGDDPMDVLHVIESLAIFAPHKVINAQIWTTNFAGINLEEFDLMGAQEGTDRLFKGAIIVNLRSMNVGGGPRSEYLHTFLRSMWKRRSKERPKYIRENINLILNNTRKIIAKFQYLGENQPTKQEVKDILKDQEPDFIEFIIDLVRKENSDLADIINRSL